MLNLTRLRLEFEYYFPDSKNYRSMDSFEIEVGQYYDHPYYNPMFLSFVYGSQTTITEDESIH